MVILWCRIISGITNTTGRILAGWLADRPGVNPLILHNLAIMLGGVACILNMFATNYAGMCIFAAFFGLCVGKSKHLHVHFALL